MKLPKRARFDIGLRTFAVAGLLAACLIVTAVSPNSHFPVWIVVAATILVGVGTFMIVLANERFTEEMIAPARQAQEALRSREDVDYDAIIEALSRPRVDPALSWTGVALCVASFALVAGGLIHSLAY